MASHFVGEVFHFGEDQDNLSEFVEMLKSRKYYIGEDWHIRSYKGNLCSRLMRNGYYLTSATYECKTHYFMEHRVIWCWINGSIPKGLVVNHKDFNRANNNIDNLELLTQKENTDYSACNRNSPSGEANGRSVFTDKQAQAIKFLGKSAGWSSKKIQDFIGAKHFTTVSRIVNNQRYANVIDASSIIEVYSTIVDFTRNKKIGKVEELKNYCLGLSGEVGEFNDIIKKHLYHGKDIDMNDLIYELGDILYYLTAIGNVIGFDMSEIMMNNNVKLMSRYKDGYSEKASNDRIEDKH